MVTPPGNSAVSGSLLVFSNFLPTDSNPNFSLTFPNRPAAVSWSFSMPYGSGTVLWSIASNILIKGESVWLSVESNSSIFAGVTAGPSFSDLRNARQ